MCLLQLQSSMNIVSITRCNNMMFYKCFNSVITIGFVFVVFTTFFLLIQGSTNEEVLQKNDIADPKNSPLKKDRQKDRVNQKPVKNQLLRTVRLNQTESSVPNLLKNSANRFNSTVPDPPDNLTPRASRRWCRRTLKGRKRRQCIRRAQKALRKQRQQEQQHRHRHHHSLKCSRCSPGQFMASRCTREQDTLCSSCPGGTYTPHHSHRQQCLRCSQCGPTLYTLHACSPVADAVCDSCQSATKRGPPFAGDYYLKCFSVATELFSETAEAALPIAN